MKRIQGVLAAIAGTSLLMAGSLAVAQSAKPQPTITVTNARTVAITLFEIASTGDNPKLVGKLAKPLAPGKSAKVALKGAKGCSYYVLARFEDDSETNAEDMDLCTEKVVRLTD